MNYRQIRGRSDIEVALRYPPQGRHHLCPWSEDDAPSCLCTPLIPMHSVSPSHPSPFPQLLRSSIKKKYIRCTKWRILSSRIRCLLNCMGENLASKIAPPHSQPLYYVQNTLRKFTTLDYPPQNARALGFEALDEVRFTCRVLLITYCFFLLYTTFSPHLHRTKTKTRANPSCFSIPTIMIDTLPRPSLLVNPWTTNAAGDIQSEFYMNVSRFRANLRRLDIEKARKKSCDSCTARESKTTFLPRCSQATLRRRSINRTREQQLCPGNCLEAGGDGV